MAQAVWSFRQATQQLQPIDDKGKYERQHNKDGGMERLWCPKCVFAVGGLVYFVVTKQMRLRSRIQSVPNVIRFY